MTIKDDGLQPTITTYTGVAFNILKPEFNITDIAHGLSNTCRYAGQCNEFYSVAEHSVLVSKLVETLDLGDPFIGLMHDAHEAYFSDVPSPFKQLLPDWVAIDLALEEAVYKHFDMVFPREEGIKEADVIAYFIEKQFLFADWNTNLTYLEVKFPGYTKRATDYIEDGWDIHCYDPWMAKKRFLERYDKLQEQAGKD